MTFTRLLYLFIFWFTVNSVSMEHPFKSQSAPHLPTTSPRTLATLPRPLSLTATDCNQSAALNPFVAVRKKNLDDLKRIIRIKYIFDVNTPEEETGQTLLHYCVHNKDEAIIKFLMLEKKADPHIKNPAGRSALDTAIDCGFTHIVSVINQCLRDDLYAEAQSSIKVKTKESHA